MTAQSRKDEADATTPEGVEVFRRDFVDLAEPKRTDTGFLRAEGFITRAGVFSYMLPDGRTSRELRAPDEIFSDEALESFALVPLTLGHPEDGDDVTPENARKYAVGVIGRPVRDGDKARAEISVFDSAAIKAAASGVNQLSTGMRAMLIPMSGIWTDAAGNQHPYDAVQTRIRGNHVALVERGRAGPEARMRVDAEDAPIEVRRRDDMETEDIVIGGETYKVPKAVAEAIRRSDTAQGSAETAAKLATDLKVSRADADALRTELDACKGKIVALEATVAARSVESESKQRKDSEGEAFQQKFEMIAKAAPILGKPFAEIVRMDVADMRREVVAKEMPNTDLTGKSAEFIGGMFETIIASRKDTARELADILRPVDGQKQGDNRSLTDISLASREEMTKRQNDAWKPKN